jgi:murein DD-endopeptidase MepM/ murein hydrolase activator NlpD
MSIREKTRALRDQLCTGMDDKTVIVRPKANQQKKGDRAHKAGVAASAPPDTKNHKQPVPPAPKKRSSFPTFALAFFAMILVGVGSALMSVYYFSATLPRPPQFTAQELSTELVPVEGADNEAEDEALVKAAIEPRIINLSGDPIIVRQLSNAPHQSVKLDNDQQKLAASNLGIQGGVFRIKDVLDTPDPSLQAGLAGSQQDIAELNSFEPTASSDKTVGNSTVAAETDAGNQKLSEFAQTVKVKTTVAKMLKGLGIDRQIATTAEAAFVRFYGRSQLDSGDSFALRAATDQDATGADTTALVPVQLSVYTKSGLLGTIAMDDLDQYVQAADPWSRQDIFRTQLLPTETRPEDRPRLLDAIYAAALRNKLPAAVIGEAIMLLSRAQDLEQKTQQGDSITIIYSPSARDSKTGLGRIVYISIGRTTGNLECYAFQVQAGAKFDCVTGNGDSSVPDNGMVLPVNGVIAAKFGPQQAAGKDAKDNMNFGVDWNTPDGMPVVAAFDGEVQSVGTEDSWGMVVRLTHADNKATMYAYLKSVEPGIVAGAKVTAGQTIGQVGTPSSSREPRLHFELRENDIPVDPLPEAESRTPAGGGTVVDQFVHRIITIESANRCNARNPLSTAVGLGQFIESTWMTTVRIHRPDLLVGHSRQQVLDMRLDCNLSRAMTTAFTRDNAAVLRRSGANVTPGNLYLAHFLGVGGAVKTVNSAPGRSIEDVFGSSHVRANPFERGKSVGYLVSWAAQKMGSKAALAPAPQVAAGDKNSTKPDQNSAAAASSPDAAFQRYDGNPEFMKLKNAVLALLQ